ncbi:MAG: type 1 glutamine amidotransferase domain-containing protein [bacterium]|nr:type 1 glutamine amidotransferase domain-containing protein [bacterium]
MMKKIQKNKRTVVITAEGFEDEEVIYPVIRLKEAGFAVDIATKDAKLVLGRLNFPLELIVRYYGRLVDAKKLQAKDYDLVLIPGGFEAPDRIRQVPEILKFVRDMYKTKKIVSAFCHGPWVLISAGIVKGKKIAGYIGIKDDINNAGAIYTDQPSVIDGNIITARHPRDVTDLMKAILSKFSAKGGSASGEK